MKEENQLRKAQEMTQPLSLPEVRRLEQLRTDINKVGNKPAYSMLPLFINKNNREWWLKVLDLALEANEKNMERWRYMTAAEERAMMKQS